ncbi:MAG: DUF3298 domain-containing protein [Phycisphaerales bacterium]|nr:DUF3298 domain-containing protein [Hyphomonadaceae bacterium]
MLMRGNWIASASFALIALASCGRGGDGAKTEESSAANIAEALDICANGGDALCQNQALAQLDSAAREALVAESASISDAGAALLVQNQNRWREAARTICGLQGADAQPDAAAQRCLEERFRARAQEVREAVQEVGGYTFQRMELMDASPVNEAMVASSGLGDDAPAAIVREIRFPRIDGRQTPAIQRFNDLVAQQPQFRLEEATNEVVEYRIAFAGPELISVRFDMASDTLGAAHGSNTSKAVTVLMEQGRALTATDVFTEDSGWERFLTQRAVTEIARQYREDGFTPPERDVQESVTKPHLWLITEQGLTLLFPPYSFGAPYVMGGTEVSIPWADLRAYLNPAAPAPIRPSA